MTPLNVVWIIDDDPIFTYGLKKLISITNFCSNLVCFENGEEALKKINLMVNGTESLPDVIFLDLNMPVIDGWQFLDAFKQLRPSTNIRIYVTSSSIDIVDHTKAGKYDVVTGFLVKPLRKTDLLEVLQEDLEFN